MAAVKEKYYELERGEVELEELANSLTRLNPDIENRLHECDDIVHYEGYSVQASFSENRAYAQVNCGVSNREDLAVLSFLEYESGSIPGKDISYSRTGRTDFTGYEP